MFSGSWDIQLIAVSEKKHDKNSEEEIIKGSMLELNSMNFQAESISITTDKNLAKAHFHEM